MILIERANSTQQTIDTWLGASFQWGARDCGQMVGHHLENIGITTQLAKAGNYKTELGARRSMRRLGASSMEDFLDKLGFERIAPAAAIVGDVVGFPGGTEARPWTALGVHVGDARILGFAAAPDEVAIVRVGPVEVCTVAWRVK